MSRSHVPKFGNWEADNIPYSACFESARREKAGFMMNPNDPTENPDAFYKVVKNVNAEEMKPSQTYSHKASSSSMEKGSHELLKNNSTRQLQRRRSRESKDSFKSEFGNEKSNADHHSVINKTSQSDHKRNVSKGGSGNIGSFNSSNHSRHGNRSHSFNNHVEHKATPIPEFGKWDVKDPKSGEGYTVMFSKIKEERKIMSSRITGIRTPPHHNGSNLKNQYDESSSGLSKYCCCLSPRENK